MIKMKENNKVFEVNGVKITNDVPPITLNDRTYVPIRFIAEHMGLNVDWDEKTNIVTIYGRKKYFKTIDECAYDWGMHFNAASIAMYKEFGGIFYQDENGFYWDNVFIGQDKEVFWAIPEVRKGVAFIHSHSGGKPALTDTMSKADKTGAKKCNRPIYMVDSGGQLHIYDPTQENVKDRVQKKVADGLPVDGKYMDITESSKRMKEYFAQTGYHDIVEYDFGYIVDYYNKMYMAGICYTKPF